MPDPEILPPSLRPLVFRNAVQVRPDPDFHNDMDRLIAAIENLFEISDAPEGLF
jgi:hypothetical protein